MEAPHPLLQPAVIGFHIVDVEIWRLRAGRAGRGQDMDLDPGAPSECGDRCTSIAAKFGWPGNDLPERGRDAGGVEPRQDGIDGRAGAVAGDDDWDLLRRQTPPGGLAAPLARCSRQIAALGQVADIKSEPRPASDRSRCPASYRNAWPGSSESAHIVGIRTYRVLATRRIARRQGILSWTSLRRRLEDRLGALGQRAAEGSIRPSGPGSGRTRTSGRRPSRWISTMVDRCLRMLAFQLRLTASTAMSSDCGAPAAWALTEANIAATVSSTERSFRPATVSCRRRSEYSSSLGFIASVTPSV